MKKDKEYIFEEPSAEVLQAVKNISAEGRLNCPQAWALAKQLSVPVPVVGRAADILGVRIMNCSLGCFK
ncbi:hypothetical protein DCCM_3768 [Desulfocucumis palustris]|uniref:Uncharacterized protein n=1 Tax=Desulfocucumis palustris TaxID=1898651 RepID=A0A2L2XEJ0_9FIRM|nr:hypothetical protein [Desulfocucumis palustris]GBF34648.1 hypothetical protein DCCM_3768 [Desulfocucumis palustris]